MRKDIKKEKTDKKDLSSTETPQSYIKPKIVRIRRVIAAGGHKV